MIFAQIAVHEIAKEYIDSYNKLVDSHEKFWVWLVVGISVQILSAVLSFLMQLRLKNLEKNITKFNLREEKRISVMEDVYQKMSELTWFFPGESVVDLNDQIKIIDKLVTSKALYLSNNVRLLVGRYLDHFRNVASNPNRKDISKEEKMLDEFSSFFNQ